jgi:hypothetical protein
VRKKILATDEQKNKKPFVSFVFFLVQIFLAPARPGWVKVAKKGGN